MRRKKAPRRTGTTRRLAALSAAVAAAWTLGRSVSWQAVGDSLAGLRDSSRLVEELVRQELARPVTAGENLSLWEQLIVSQSPQLLTGQAAVEERQAGERNSAWEAAPAREADPVREAASARQTAPVRETEEERAARQRAEGEASAEKEESARKAAARKKRAAQKRAAKRKAARTKKGRVPGTVDVSGVKSSALRLDNHTRGISVRVSDFDGKKTGLKLRPAEEGPQILILHTHTTEAYTKGKGDKYRETDTARTTDEDYNMVRVGEEMKKTFTAMGLSVVHDKTKYDYPSYTGSYSRALTGIQKQLKKYPTIQVVLDVHRDAIIGSDGTSYAKKTRVDGETAAQVMLVVGTDDMGLTHPEWRKHLALAVQIQKGMLALEETFPRPIDLRRQRFNEHAAPGSLLVEVGTSGNTLKEALAGARLFARAAGSCYLARVK